MRTLSKSTWILGCSISFALSSPTAFSKRDGPSCTEIFIPVTLSTEAFNAGPPITHTPVVGTFNIGARYCEPQVQVSHREDTLQVLVHGATYTRNYWSADSPPGQQSGAVDNSWIWYAGSLGYPTVSIDRICNGLSDHLFSPLCTIGVNVEVVHQLITLARNGTLSGPASRAFNKIVYVGHSAGSEIGNFLHATYPNDTDVAIFTGWSDVADLARLAVDFEEGLGSAPYVDPTKYGNLDPYYFEFDNITIFQEMFYHAGSYDVGLFDLDYSTRGTFAYGETQFETSPPNIDYISAPDFTGPIHVMTGEYDWCFCPTNTGSNPPICTLTDLTGASSLYPVASSSSGYVIPSAGHSWNFHLEALDGFAEAHTFLSDQGY